MTRTVPGKILSGGQTGVDRAALDFAIERGIPWGGWAPQGWRSEDPGGVPERYREHMRECPRDRPGRRRRAAHPPRPGPLRSPADRDAFTAAEGKHPICGPCSAENGETRHVPPYCTPVSTRSRP